MSRTHRIGVLGVLVLVVLLGLLLAAGPASAIIGGTQDATNIYSNVGLVVQWGAFIPGQWGFAGTCTLVSNRPGNVVVLCGAHQLYGWAATDNRVTFEAVPDFGWEWTDLTGIGLDNVETYAVIRQELYPGYVYKWSNSRPQQIGPGQDDVALMWLKDRVRIPGTNTLMPTRLIVGLHGLDSLDLTSETFTGVGYGLTEWLQGSIGSTVAGGRSVVAWDGRYYRDDLYVTTENAAFSDRYLQVSFGQSANDSGSPLLHDGIVAAVADGGPAGNGCGSYNYRLDTQSAQDFLHANGVPTLP